MTAPNHVVGGFTFTGFFASVIFSINILSNPLFLVLTVFASLLPDIDHPKSIFGRLFKPISRKINRHFGHRTLTHSAPCWIILTVISCFLNKLFFNDFDFAIIISLAYLSHLVFDMFTLMGVQFAYPFSRQPFWMFDNPEYRLRTGSVRGEAIWMFVFIGLFLMMQGLFEKGFWTTYNQALSGHGHLYSEFNKADDILKLEYSYKEGSQVFADSGLCIDVNMNQIAIWKNEEFKILTADKLATASFEFEHTGKKMYFEKHSFREISPDSLNQIIQGLPVLEINVFANNSFEYVETNFPESTKKLSKKFIPQIRFSANQDNTPKEEFKYLQNPRIITLRKKLEIEKSIFAGVSADYRKSKLVQEQLRKRIKNESDLVKRQRLQEEYLKLQKVISAKPTNSKIEEIESQISELKSLEIIDNNLRKLEVEERNFLNQKPKTILTGNLSLLIIKNENYENSTFTNSTVSDICPD